ncbi:MAG: Unknown protein, partial [uncultured Aureispira sp.]
GGLYLHSSLLLLESPQPMISKKRKHIKGYWILLFGSIRWYDLSKYYGDISNPIRA